MDKTETARNVHSLEFWANGWKGICNAVCSCGNVTPATDMARAWDGWAEHVHNAHIAESAPGLTC